MNQNKILFFFKLLILCLLAKGAEAQWQPTAFPNFAPSAITAGTILGSDFGATSGEPNAGGAGMVFDNNVLTYFDADISGYGNGRWAGKDLGASYELQYIGFYPRSGGSGTGYRQRMIGGKFQVSSNAAFTNPVTLYTIPAGAMPSDAWYYIMAPASGAPVTRYVRYLAPDGSYGNIGELKFYGTAINPNQGVPQSLAGDLYTNSYIITRNNQSHNGHGIYLTDTSVQISELVTGTDPNGTWPDFVFDEGYPLTPLAELESYVTSEKHLPGIASAAEMKKRPYYRVDDMIQKLLMKVEELTLYLIQHDKENKALTNAHNSKEQVIEGLNRQLDQLERKGNK